MMIYIIAEIGINHNGDINLCKNLIDVAKDAGCNAVKFQKRTIDTVYSQKFLNQQRESPWGKTQREQKIGLELSEQDYCEINRYCKEVNIDWFASAWDLESQHFLRQFCTPMNKVASAMLVDKIFLESVAEEKKHTFVSTGMSTLDQIETAVQIFKKHDCPFELMHTVSNYPMNDEDANLNLIPKLRRIFKCNIGYSGHETGLAISYAAAALGITSLERHITLDRSMYGSDQAASVEPAGLRQLVGGVRKIEKAMGNGEKFISEKELMVARKLREHIKLTV